METETLDYTGAMHSNREEIEKLKEEIETHLIQDQAHELETATRGDWWRAISLTVRGRMMERACEVRRAHRLQNVKRVYYLSLEYLMGRLLVDNLVNLRLLDSCRTAVSEMGKDFEEIVEEGADLGLGNGGLGRLAACFMDSLATLDYPAVGYGIYYEFGLFRQKFIDVEQAE